MLKILITAVWLIALPVHSVMAPATDEAKMESILETGKALPALEGNYLTGRSARLPADARGKIALLALGFTYESRFAVAKWCDRFAEEFAKSPEVTFFEIPLIGGAGRLARWFIDGSMRRGTPKERQENVITVYGGTDSWKQRMGFKEPDHAYLILIDRQGIIRWLYAGPFDDSEFTALVAAVRRISGPQ